MQEVNSDFNPRDPHGSRRLFIGVAPFYKPISIHATLTGRDHRPFFSKILPTFYFNPRDPHGSRPILIPSLSLCCHFNPRDPHGSRPLLPCCSLRRKYRFQSTRPSRVATSARPPRSTLIPEISIHATLTGRDKTAKCGLYYTPISIHATLTGRDRGKRRC